MRLKTRVHQILENTEEHDPQAIWFMVLIAFLIVFSVASVILESVESFYDKYYDFFIISEYIVVSIFTLEYVLRLWSCTEDSRYNRPIKGRLRFIFTFFMIIDLMAILPFYLPFFIMDARYLRIFRLLRIFRVAKMTRYSKSVKLMIRVAKRERENLLVAVSIIVILIIVASCLMWYVESEAQPDEFGSIPETMWWAVSTLTTVGYGDVVPITPMGKFLGAFIAVLGIGVIAGPSGIVVSGFLEEARKDREGREKERGDAHERVINLLERLHELRKNETLTEEEFQREKDLILSRNK